jgi:O-antigen ligase
MLDSEHMHNSYLHSMIQSGILGGLVFAAAIIAVWVLIIKHKLIKRVKFLKGNEKKLLMSSILLTGFLTSRSFFESTAAFYGVDLLILVPAVSYIFSWAYSHPLDTP